jgi:hypothetical protein
LRGKPYIDNAIYIRLKKKAIFFGRKDCFDTGNLSLVYKRVICFNEVVFACMFFLWVSVYFLSVVYVDDVKVGCMAIQWLEKNLDNLVYKLANLFKKLE